MRNIKKLYGLVGYPLSHSFSQKYFRQKFINESIDDADFLNFELKNIKQMLRFVYRQSNLGKRFFCYNSVQRTKLFSFLMKLMMMLLQIGAVNSVTCHSKLGILSILKGYNTDYYGFKNH